MIKPHALCALLLAILVLPAGSVAGETRAIRYQGIERHYFLHNARAEATSPQALIVFLHGYRKKEEALAAREDLSVLGWSALNSQADKEGFLVVYPAARFGQWGLFEGVKNAATDDGQLLDDVGFIVAVVGQLVAEGLADGQRVYLSGFSDGAIMTYKLLCTPELPFAAAAPIGGTMYEQHRDDCAAITATPIMVIAGTNDRVLPYDGWLFKTGREISIPETMEHFRLQHGCTGQKWQFLEDREAGDRSRVRAVTWTGCKTEGAVKLLRVEGGGHTRPSPEPVSEAWREKGGGHNQDIDSAAEVWRFLRAFRKADAGD